MATTLYLHAALNTVVTGSLPSAIVGSTPPALQGGNNPTPPGGQFYPTGSDGLTVNRLMDQNVGSSEVDQQISFSMVTGADRSYFYGKWISLPLAAQTISANTWNWKHAVAEGHLTQNFILISPYLYVWRPSTGAIVGWIQQGASSGGAEPTGVSLEKAEISTFSGAAVTCQAGDVLIFEAWEYILATANASTVADFFYDGGTTPAGSSGSTTISDSASQLITPQTITFQTLVNTLQSRKNGANGTITQTWTVASTTLIQDTSHSDSVVLGDDYDWQITDSLGDQANYTFLSADFVSNNGDMIFSCANGNTVTFNTSVTDYVGLAGDLEYHDTTETNTQVLVNGTYVFSQLTVNVTTDAISLNSTVNLRANAGNTGVTASITANTTGIFVDNVNTYTASSTDEMNYQIVTGSTGTSLKIEHISVWANNAPGAAVGGPSYQHFDNSTQVNRQNLNAFGGQLTIFG